MSNRIMASFVVSAALIGAAGCNQSPQGGNPGTNDSFKVSAPSMATTLKQGEKETVKLSVVRGTDFKKAVAIKADAPTGLKVVMNTTSVKASDPADLSFTVEADKTAPLGDHTVKITATPDSGAATVVDVKVTVTEKPKT